MVPAKTIERIGQGQYLAQRERFASEEFYPLMGVDLNDLACLMVRLNSRMDDGDELRDWQNRLSLMIANASNNRTIETP